MPILGSAIHRCLRCGTAPEVFRGRHPNGLVPDLPNHIIDRDSPPFPQLRPWAPRTATVCGPLFSWPPKDPLESTEYLPLYECYVVQAVSLLLVLRTDYHALVLHVSIQVLILVRLVREALRLGSEVDSPWPATSQKDLRTPDPIIIRPCPLSPSL
jgi:hypothetical protein